MNKHNLVTLVLVLAGALASCATPQPVATGMQLFLLAGQSNMAGRGTVEEIDQTPHPRIFMLNKELEWVPATEPLHFDKPHRVGVGPGFAFARAVAEEHPDIRIGLIPTAAGGSPIESWTPGGYHEATQSHPWDDAVRRTRHALQDGELKAVLWHQGEADSRNAERSLLYEERLVDLVERFRKELDAPDLPFFVGQLGRFDARPWDENKERVDAVHRRMPELLPDVYFVSAEGLSDSDGVHFDSPSARELGKRYAGAWLSAERAR